MKKIISIRIAAITLIALLELHHAQKVMKRAMKTKMLTPF
jgi:hypothetical protein